MRKVRRGVRKKKIEKEVIKGGDAHPDKWIVGQSNWPVSLLDSDVEAVPSSILVCSSWTLA